MTTYAIKFVVRDVNPTDMEPHKTVAVSFAESERSMYKFTKAGILTMPAEIWMHLAQAIERGVRRPMAIIQVEEEP